jgi:inner membrane protein
MLPNIRDSHLARLAILSILTALLLIPTSMIRGLVEERHDLQQSAIKEVTSKWGGRQSLTGPVLVLPYTVRTSEKTPDGKETIRTTVRNVIFLPKRLKTAGLVTTEIRGRGIFEVPVYSFSATIEGEFDKPNLQSLSIDPSLVDWPNAQIAIGISDVRALRTQPTITWNGKTSEFLPGTGGFREAEHGLHAAVSAGPEDAGYKFSFPVSVNGGEAIYLTPFGEETVMQLRSNSPYPNFQGNWLPTDRTVTKDGFEATWRVSYLGRNYPQAWIAGNSASLGKTISDSAFGVELNNPIDQYRMADRSVKYAGLFILLTFTSIWLVEVLAKSSVHPVQYLMLGAALCIFYLLELSLSEHIPFSIAYGIASIAIVAMVGAYGRTLFRRGQRGFIVPAGITLLYAYLYVLLTNEEAALLVGSIGLFTILATIMFMTRGVNWYSPVAVASEAKE